MQLMDARIQAAEALEASQKLAHRLAQKRRGLPAGAAPTGEELGAIIGSPAAFWAGAMACRVEGDDCTVGGIAAAIKLASARMVAGDLGFVRESLLGQAQWASVVAVNMAARADAAGQPEQAVSFSKLALAAQRQAAQCLASAAALDRLNGEVTVGG